MMRLSRLGLATTLAVVFAASTVRAAEPDSLLPADADSIAFVNVKQLVESDVVKKYAIEQIKQALAGQEAKKILEEMGLDPLKDVEKVWVGMSGKDKDDMKVLTIVHGKFDPQKLFKAAEAASKKDGDKFTMIKDGNNTLFKFQPENGNPVYGTVVNETTVIAGSDKKIISTALKQAEDKKKAPINDDLTALVKKMDDKSSLFMASVVKGKLDKVKVPNQFPIDLAPFEKALPNTETMSLVVKVTGDINLEINFGMKDDDSASDMGDAMVKIIDGIKGLAPLVAASDPKFKPITDVVKTIKSDVKKKDVTVVGKVTGEALGKMIAPGE